MVYLDCNDNYIYTDLALESYKSVENTLPHGISYCEYDSGGITVSELRVTSEEGAEALGRKKGTYITLSVGRLWEDERDASDNAAKVLSQNINDMMHSVCQSPERVLVCGLGNRLVTPDALGPAAADKIRVTRHIKEENPRLFSEMCAYDISAISTGVVAQTGVETAEFIKGVAKTVSPSLIIVLDALAARDVDRLATTIQLCDSGISPGSGIGQKRKEISKETMGVPVMSIGVPTVVSSATLVYDALYAAGDEVDAKLKNVLETGRSFFVSINESDVMISTMSDVISLALNRVFFPE